MPRDFFSAPAPFIPDPLTIQRWRCCGGRLSGGGDGESIARARLFFAQHANPILAVAFYFLPRRRLLGGVAPLLSLLRVNRLASSKTAKTDHLSVVARGVPARPPPPDPRKRSRRCCCFPRSVEGGGGLMSAPSCANRCRRDCASSSTCFLPTTTPPTPSGTTCCPPIFLTCVFDRCPAAVIVIAPRRLYVSLLSPCLFSFFFPPLDVSDDVGKAPSLQGDAASAMIPPWRHAGAPPLFGRGCVSYSTRRRHR